MSMDCAAAAREEQQSISERGSEKQSVDNDSFKATDDKDSCYEEQDWRKEIREKDGISNEGAGLSSGFEVVWLNFSYSVGPNLLEDPRWGRINGLFHKQARTILRGLSGGARSGQLVALMGPSGAGKTCLLECIAGLRVTGIDGELSLRGRKSVQLNIVPQYDSFMSQFTVEEIIRYGSRMKNAPDADHAAIADKVIIQLGLDACRSNNINKCSGGQRKRVAIAQELVSRPNILILDEPTSGLDSSRCYQTMKVLRDVLDESTASKQPMAIITTIHQPSAKVFKMFDLIYVLGKTGYMAYSGRPDELVRVIGRVTGLQCPQYSNPSDFVIELVSYDYGEAPVEKMIEYEREKARKFALDYELRSGASERQACAGRAPSTEPDRRWVRPGLMDANRAFGNAVAGARDLLRYRPEAWLAIGAYNNRNVFPMSSCPDPCIRSSKSDSQLTLQSTETQLCGETNQDPNRAPFTPSDVHTNGDPAKARAEQPCLGGHVKYLSNISVPLRTATDTSNSQRSFLWHTWVHFHRSLLQSTRDPILNNMRIFIHLCFAVFLVVLFGQEPGKTRGCPPILGLPTEITDPNNDNMVDLADNVGYLYMCMMMITYVSLMSMVLTFPIDIKTVGREYKNGWYETVTYFIGKTMADTPFIVIYPIVFSLITWFLTNQAGDHSWRFYSYTGLIIMNAMNSQSFGLILGATFVNSVTAATFLGPLITIPWYLFTGFTKRVHRLSEPYRTTSKFLFTRHIFEGLLDTVYGYERCNCSDFLHQYHSLRLQEALRLGQIISAEALSSLDYYDSFEPTDVARNATTGLAGGWFAKTVDAASTVFADGEDLNLASLMETNGKASSLFSFGLDFEPTCPENYRNFVIQDFRIEEGQYKDSFVMTLIMLAMLRMLTFVVVTWKIKTRQIS